MLAVHPLFPLLLLLLGFLHSTCARQATPIRDSLGFSASIPDIQSGSTRVFQKESKDEALKLIKELSPNSTKGNLFKGQRTVCYTDECLDASFSLLKSMNLSVNPCDDFYEFACGRWRADNPIPDIFTSWGSFNILRDEVNNITLEILKSPKSARDFRAENQTKDVFASCIDTDALERAGVSVIPDQTGPMGCWPNSPRRLKSVKSYNLLESMAEARRLFREKIIVGVYVGPDSKNTSRNVIYLDQPDFMLPRSMLLNPTVYAKQVNATIKYYVDLATEMAANTGVDVTEAQLTLDARDVLAFEAALARISSADEDRGNVSRIYNPTTLDQYQAVNDFGWTMYLDHLFSTSGVTVQPDERIIVLEQDYLRNLVDILIVTPEHIISNYIHFRLVSVMAGDTTQKMRDIQFKFDHVMTGLAEPLPREKLCATIAMDYFGMAIAIKYVQRGFAASAKDNVNEMVQNLRTAFKELVVESSWLESTTKLNALRKVDKMREFMAFPDWLFNETRINIEYEGIEELEAKAGVQAIHSCSYMNTLITLRLWRVNKDLGMLRKPTDKDRWIMDPPVVNAGYMFEYNSITFPAGILHPPFYRINGPESLNYGGIGVVAGHEISHGFDFDGRQYDADGNAFNWWTPNDLSNFVSRAQCMVNQYSAFTVPGADGKPLYVNGNLTRGENIADNGGVRQSFRAYQSWIRNQNGGTPEKRLPGLEFLTPNQLFFLGFAKVWCSNTRPSKLIQRVNTDPHSPDRFRVLGALQNSQDFAHQWRCPVGSRMNPTRKCVIW